MVQLLRDGLVFQLLCVQLVWRSSEKSKHRIWQREERETERKEDLADEAEYVWKNLEPQKEHENHAAAILFKNVHKSHGGEG